MNMRRIDRKHAWRALPLLLVGIVGCSPAGPGTSNTTVSVTTAEVTKQDLVGYTFYDAETSVPPTAKAIVYAPFKLPVKELLVSVGKRVNRGQVMMRLAVPNASESVAMAQANLQSARSAYAAARAQNDAPVREAARALAEARMAERAARQDPTADLTMAEQARKEAEIAHQSAIADLNSLTVNEKLSVDAAAQYLAEVKRGARMADVRAPIAGTVVSLDAVVGNEVGGAPKSPVATIVDLSAIMIRMNVPAEKKDDVKIGDKVVFSTIDTGAQPIEGTVKTLRVIPPKPGEKATHYVAMVSFDNSRSLIKPESVVKRAGVYAGKVEDVLVVPIEAVSQNKDGKMIVHVQNGSNWVETPVQLGLSDGALIEVKSGLNEGAIVRVTKETTPAPVPDAGG